LSLTGSQGSQACLLCFVPATSTIFVEVDVSQSMCWA